MRVAVLANHYPATSETFVKRHVSSLFDGDTVVVCKNISEKICDKNYFEFEKNRDCFSLLKTRAGNAMNLLTGQPFHALRGQLKRDFLRFCDKEGVTCIIAEFGTLAGVAVSLAEERDIPVYVFFRGYDATVALKRWPIRHSLRRSEKKVKGFFAVSQFLLDRLDKQGFNHANSHVLPSGVDTEKFIPGIKKARSCLFVGRFIEKKQPLLTIEAFLRSSIGFPDATLEMIGEGPLLEPAKELVKKLGVEGKVSFLGAQPHDIVRQKMSNAAILIQHSVVCTTGNTEGLPSSIQEAMSCGMAVVATLHAGIPEVITQGVNGVMVEERDKPALIKTIQYLLESPSEVDRLGKQARLDAVSFLDCWDIQRRLEEIIMADIEG